MRYFLGLAAELIAMNLSMAARGYDEVRQQAIELPQVPPLVREAATRIMEAPPTEARLVMGSKPQQFELEGKTADGSEVVVDIDSNGKVLSNWREPTKTRSGAPKVPG